MTISYEYTITSILAYTVYEGNSNCVYFITWRIIGTDGTYSSTVINETSIPYDPNTQYIPADQLTLAELVNWIETYTPRLPEIKNDIDNDIAAQSTALPIVALSIPTE
jgi:hypothetical protein